MNLNICISWLDMLFVCSQEEMDDLYYQLYGWTWEA